MRKRYASLLFALCFVAAPLLSPAYAQQSGAMKTAKIGVISPLSGPLTFVGTSMLRCVQLAVKDVNEKGTLGNSGPALLIGKGDTRWRSSIMTTLPTLPRAWPA